MLKVTLVEWSPASWWTEDDYDGNGLDVNIMVDKYIVLTFYNPLLIGYFPIYILHCGYPYPG